MAIYRQVHVSFWQDGFIGDLPTDEKYFYLYLMTNPHTSQCGIYELPKKHIAFESGYSINTVCELLQKFIDYNKILYNESTKEIILLNWLRYNSMKSPKVQSCVKKELQAVKYKPFINTFLSVAKDLGYSIDSLSIDLGEEEEQEEEQEEEYKNNYLNILVKIKNYPFDEKTDIEMIQRLTEKYPTVDLLKVLQDYAINKLDKPIRPKDNPRSQLNTFCKKAEEWGTSQKQEKPQENKGDGWGIDKC